MPMMLSTRAPVGCGCSVRTGWPRPVISGRKSPTPTRPGAGVDTCGETDAAAGAGSAIGMTRPMNRGAFSTCTLPKRTASVREE